MARKKLTQKLLGFPFFHVQTNGFTFPLTHEFTENLTGLDGLSLNLQFATDKTLTARKGPTPVFTRASNATHYGPLVNFGGQTYPTTGIVGGRAEWKIVDGSDYKSFEYTGSFWRYTEFFFGDGTSFDSAPTSAFRPEQANWSASGLTTSPTTSSTFGIVRSAVNEPRFDHATTAPNACRGLLIEESKTNLVFPSDTLTTQTRTVTATAHTLSFYGTGTVVLSGVAIATVTGTGAFPTRTTLTFTPTAGSLIMTVTGSVQFAQLEVGPFPTSYIPTTTASVIRSQDICSITGSAFTGFYNQPEGTFFTQSTKVTTNGNAQIINANANNTASVINIRYSNITTVDGGIFVSGVGQLTGTQATITSGSSPKQALAYKLNDCAYSANGASAIIDTVATIPTVSQLNIGMQFNNGFGIGGHIASIRYFKKRLANAKLQTLTT